MNVYNANYQILQELKNSPQSLLFRGQTDSCRLLIPSIYRETIDKCRELKHADPHIKFHLDHILLKNMKYLIANEPGYSEHVRSVNPRELDTSIWQFLQHYGAYTPYLDWTQSFTTALMFSLFKFKILLKIDLNDTEKLRSLCVTNPIAIYTLNPANHNQLDAVIIDPYRLTTSNPRIISQQGKLILLVHDFDFEKSTFSGRISKYIIEPELAIDFFCKILEEDNTYTNLLESILIELRTLDTIETKSLVNKFLASFNEIINSCPISGHDTSSILRLKLRAIDNLPIQTSTGKCDPTQIIMIGSAFSK